MKNNPFLVTAFFFNEKSLLSTFSIRSRILVKKRTLRITFMAKVNLYYVTKFSFYLRFSVGYIYTRVRTFMPGSSLRMILDRLCLPIFKCQLESNVCRLPQIALVKCWLLLLCRSSHYVNVSKSIIMNVRTDGRNNFS